MTMDKKKGKSTKKQPKNKKAKKESEIVIIDVDPRYYFFKEMMCAREHKALFEGLFGRKKK